MFNFSIGTYFEVNYSTKLFRQSHINMISTNHYITNDSSGDLKLVFSKCFVAAHKDLNVNLSHLFCV